MGNKYVWVLFNLISAISFLFLLIYQDLSGIDNEDGWIVLAVYGISIYWIYKAIRYWRRCIQIDNPNFDQVVGDISGKSEMIRKTTDEK